MKKIVSLITLCLLGFISTSTVLQSGDFTCEINSPDTNTVMITGYTGTGGDVVIPSIIDGNQAELEKAILGKWSWDDDIEELLEDGTGSYWRHGKLEYKFTYQVGENSYTKTADRDCSASNNRVNTYRISISGDSLQKTHVGSGYITYWKNAEEMNVQSKVNVIEPRGAYAEIDTTLVFEMIDVFEQGSASKKKKAIAKIKAHPEKYAPPVFYLLSQVLYENDKDEAIFWFCAGQLRAEYDASRCADKSAAAAINVLDYEFGPLIYQYTSQHPDLLKKIIPEVVRWDEKTPYEYDHRWINLHGMGAYISQGKDVILSKPKEEWDAIARKTRDEYVASYEIPPQRELNEMEKKFIGKWAGSRADFKWEIHRKADRTYENVAFIPDTDRSQKAFEYYSIGIWWVDGKDYKYADTQWWSEEEDGGFDGLETEVLDVIEADRIVTLSDDDEEDITNIEIRVDAFKLQGWMLNPAKKNGEQGRSNHPATAPESKVEGEEKSHIKTLTIKAEQGDADAQFCLGCMYDSGDGVPEEDKQAIKWYTKAAEQGHALAQNNLGCMYNNGEGVPEDDKQAIKWFAKAVDQGNPHAQFNLFRMYDNGDGVLEDDKQTVKCKPSRPK